MSKRMIALFSLLALFSISVMAQDTPKNTVKKKNAVKTVSPSKYAKKKAVKANVAPARINK